MAGPFASALEMEIFSRVPVDSGSRTRIQYLIGVASGLIRAYCDQTLSQVVNDVITLYPTASTFLSLPERPVVSVSQVLVDGTATTAYYVVPRGIRSGTVAVPGSAWTKGATVTYTHGFAESSQEYNAIKAVCLAAASRALTMNRDGASEAFGNTVIETAGYGPEVFLTPGEKETLRRFQRGPVR